MTYGEGPIRVKTWTRKGATFEVEFDGQEFVVTADLHREGPGEWYPGCFDVEIRSVTTVDGDEILAWDDEAIADEIRALVEGDDEN